MLKFIDLFCGIGGFRLALEEFGLECVFSCDIDPHVQETYKLNFGEKPEGDVTLIPSDRMPRHNVLCAGFPCQPFSISGKMKGTGEPNGRLFFEVLRIAKYHKPSVLLLENVKNILSIDGGNVVKTIRKELGKIGYDLHINALNASHFGVPQARERVYFVALRKNTEAEYNINYIPPKETGKQIFLEDLLESDVDKKLILNRSDVKIFKNENEIEKALKPIRVGIINKGSQGERIYSPKGHAVTQTAMGGGGGAKTGLYNTVQGVRILTVTECKKVMGFPAKHIVSDGSKGYRQLGNAVIPDMIKCVYGGISCL